MKRFAEFALCLARLDVPSARKLWADVHPGWDQPESDEEMLLLLHMARVRSRVMPPWAKAYSRRWLEEQMRPGIAAGVGIAVGSTASEHIPTRRQGIAVRQSMEDAVAKSQRAGIDIDKEAPEVRRRILEARAKEKGYGWRRWHWW